MDILPFPKTRHGWLAGLFVAIILYSVYYIPCGGYKQLYKYYVDQLSDERAYILTENQDDKCDEFKDLKVSIVYPINYAPYINRTVSLRIIDEISDHKKISISIISSADNYPIQEHIHSSIEIDDLPHNETYRGEINVSYDSSESLNNGIELIVNECAFRQEYTPVKIKMKPFAGIIHPLTETVLLPPWSNVFILFFSLILCWLVEKRAGLNKDIKKEDPFTKSSMLIIKKVTLFATWLATVVILFFAFLILIAQQEYSIWEIEFWVGNNPLWAYLALIDSGVLLFIISNQVNLFNKKEKVNEVANNIIQVFRRNKISTTPGPNSVTEPNGDNKVKPLPFLIILIILAILLILNFFPLGKGANGWDGVMIFVIIFAYWGLGVYFWKAQKTDTKSEVTETDTSVPEEVSENQIRDQNTKRLDKDK
jgi:hypothetical protein